MWRAGFHPGQESFNGLLTNNSGIDPGSLGSHPRFDPALRLKMRLLSMLALAIATPAASNLPAAQMRFESKPVEILNGQARETPQILAGAAGPQKLKL